MLSILYAIPVLVRPPQGHPSSAPQARTPLAPETGTPRASSSSGSRGDGSRHSCSCHETSTSPRVCPDSIRNFASIPPPESGSALALEAGLLRGRLRSMEATPPRPTSNELEVATLGFDDRRSSALHPCSPSGYEFAPSRACPSAPRSSPRPLSGVGATRSVLARTPIPSGPPSWPAISPINRTERFPELTVLAPIARWQRPASNKSRKSLTALATQDFSR